MNCCCCCYFRFHFPTFEIKNWKKITEISVVNVYDGGRKTRLRCSYLSSLHLSMTLHHFGVSFCFISRQTTSQLDRQASLGVCFVAFNFYFSPAASTYGNSSLNCFHFVLFSTFYFILRNNEQWAHTIYFAFYMHLDLTTPFIEKKCLLE